IDALEADSEIEEFVLRLDQRLQTRSGPKLEPRDFARLLLEQPIFPDENRDNNGHTLGLLHEELTVSSGIEKYPLHGLSVFFESDYDWTEHNFAQVGLGLGVQPAERVSIASSYRVLSQPGSNSRVLTNQLSVRLSPKYEVALLEQDDLTGGFIAQRDITLRRFGHDYVVELTYNVSQGTN